MNIKRTQVYAALIFVLTVVSVFILLLYIYYLKDNRITITDINRYQMGDIKQIQYDIEEVTSDKAGNYYIKGWCILKNVRYGYFNYGNNKTSSNVYNNMHLCIIDANKVYILPTKLEKRQDVNEFINDGIDYKYCGYRAKLNNNYISLISEHSWRIILKNIDGEESIYFLAEQSK